MKIAIIAWGSLVWNPATLEFTGRWNDDGPKLPIEFSRISADGRLTLVIDPANGVRATTLYATSKHSSLEDARKNLQTREGTISKRIEAIRLTDTPTLPINKAVRLWCASHNYDAAIWTGLNSNFQEKTNKVFSAQTALEYISSLTNSTRIKALEYINKAPSAIDTPVRRLVTEWIAKPGAL